MIRNGFYSWEEFTNKLGISNKRLFIDFFNGKQYVKKEDMEKAFNELEIPKELLDIYLEPVIRYKLKGE